MADHGGYLAKARASRAGQTAPAAAPNGVNDHAKAEIEEEMQDRNVRLGHIPYERNERNEESRDQGTAPALVLVLTRVRVGLSPGLRHWEDERLLALANWHLVVAFGRTGGHGFRRHLPRSLADLTDEEVAVLVDWRALATLEQVLWANDPEQAAQVSRGTDRLATWWNRRRASAGGTHDAASHPQRRDAQIAAADQPRTRQSGAATLGGHEVG